MRFVTLLVATPGGRDELDERIEEEAQRIRRHLNGQRQVRRAFSVGSERSTFDAVLEVLQSDESDLAPTMAALDGLASRLGDVLDPAQSVAVVGTEHLIVEGMGAIQIHACLRRAPALSVEAFRSYWRNDFAPMAKRAPHMAGYRQVHPDAAATQQAACAAGMGIYDFDGLAVEWFESAEGLQEAHAWSDHQFSESDALEHFTVERMLLSQNPAT